MKRPYAAILAVGSMLMIVIAPIVTWKIYQGRVLRNRFGSVSQCLQYRQCVAELGQAMYDLKADDPSELLRLNHLFRGQRSWSERKNANVALWPGGGIPGKLIYVVYDRTHQRILETGILQV